MFHQEKGEDGVGHQSSILGLLSSIFHPPSPSCCYILTGCLRAAPLAASCFWLAKSKAAIFILSDSNRPASYPYSPRLGAPAALSKSEAAEARNPPRPSVPGQSGAPYRFENCARHLGQRLIRIPGRFFGLSQFLGGLLLRACSRFLRSDRCQR